MPAGLQGPRTDSLYPAWREDPVQAVGHREAVGGELSRSIGIISYSSLRMKVSEKAAFFFCYAARLLSIFIFKDTVQNFV